MSTQLTGSERSLLHWL